MFLEKVLALMRARALEGIPVRTPGGIREQIPARNPERAAEFELLS